MKMKFPLLDWKCYLADFYDNTHYFIEAFEGTGQDSHELNPSQHSVTQEVECSLEGTVISKEETRKVSSTRSVCVVDVEPDSSSSNNLGKSQVSESESASHSSCSAMMDPVDLTVEDEIQVLDSGSQSAMTSSSYAILPVPEESCASRVPEGSSVSSIDAIHDTACATPASMKYSSEDDTRYYAIDV